MSRTIENLVNTSDWCNKMSVLLHCIKCVWESDFCPLKKMSFAPEHRENRNAHFWENIFCVKMACMQREVDIWEHFKDFNLIFGK